MQSMSILWLLVLCIFTSVTYGAPTMTDAQLEQALSDKNTMQRYMKCALGEGPCDPVGIRLIILAPLVLRGPCPQCTAQETRQIRRILAYVQRNYPREWARIIRQHG
ncbi:unnamed protein product [Parnassius apollo]|uniref:(apollo) hypothetical protein n=1 Tax=Parnassius apollo TaxID=110799 RepID=A0A8S3W6S4_PARAO|nr:unnamed protein product [Parnassius apollo]